MSGAPPREIIELAENLAAQSPCAKSKRGVVAYAEHPSFDGPRVVGSGFNGPPRPFRCYGDESCRATCNKYCVHAELRAIWSAWGARARRPRRLVVRGLAGQAGGGALALLHRRGVPSVHARGHRVGGGAMIVTLLDSNGNSLGDVMGTTAEKLRPLRVGDRLSLNLGGKAVREYEVIGRSEVRALGAASVKFNGETVIERAYNEHKLTLTVAPARKRRK